MTNLDFLDCIARAFKQFLETNSQSNQKLKVLHGSVAADIALRLVPDYTIKSLGFGEGKEGKIQGRYINKNVDIVISKGNIQVAGIGVKFVMQNYAQNSVNYFENMLGETANIRSMNVPYFQILIIPDEMPYYSDKKIKRWETFTTHNAHKYQVLSQDAEDTAIHTPTKTLLYIIHLPSINDKLVIKNEADYRNYYQSHPNFEIESTAVDFGTFASNVIFNDYEAFIQKIIYRVLSI
jgi:hypothetical protein